MERQIFYATHGYEIIPCHVIAKKDRIDGRQYAANSKRDKRRFQTAYATIEEAREKVVEYENKMRSESEAIWFD